MASRDVRAPTQRLAGNCRFLSRVRVCTECGEAELVDAYIRIKQRPGARYGKCRARRNRLTRERYRMSPEIRAAEIARSLRNQQRRPIERQQDPSIRGASGGHRPRTSMLFDLVEAADQRRLDQAS